jgi:hypothetical protein
MQSQFEISTSFTSATGVGLQLCVNEDAIGFPQLVLNAILSVLVLLLR